jgi:hypothetical protein
MRNVSITCTECGTQLPIEQGKEALIKQGDNDYLLIDLCAKCLDTKLQNASSVNDTDGYRQQAAVLITPKT